MISGKSIKQGPRWIKIDIDSDCPEFIVIEGRRGDYEVYTPEQTFYLNEDGDVRDFETIKIENFHYKERCEQLEQLCRDFWNTLRFEMGSDWIESNRSRMEQLGFTGDGLRSEHGNAPVA